MATEHRGFGGFWANTAGSRSWYDGLTEPERAWVSDLLDEIDAHDGVYPTWALVVEGFAADFGEQRTPASTTMAKTIRQLYRARGPDSDGG